MKVVVDTNIVVSALLTPGRLPSVVLDLAARGKIIPVLSFDILAEYQSVLGRRKLGIDTQAAAVAIEGLKANAILVQTAPWTIELSDPKDAVFLEAARAFADGVVTGNLKHFPAADCDGIRVFSPAQFLSYFDFKR